MPDTRSRNFLGSPRSTRCGVNLKKGWPAALVEKLFQFRFLLGEPEQCVGVGQDAVRAGIRGRFKILQATDFDVVRLLLATVAFLAG